MRGKKQTASAAATFIEGAENIHDNKYTYKNAIYVTSTSHLFVTCKKHGDFLVTHGNNLNGHGCKPCGYIVSGNKNRFTTEDFIKSAKEQHGELYDYSKSVYTKAHSNLIIICPKHGEFLQTASNHKQGHGCNKCKHPSSGEKLVSDYLCEHNISFVQEKTFMELNLRGKGNKYLPYDFYLEEYNMIIEFDGPHHFKPTRYHGMAIDKAIKSHETTVRNDKIKNQFAKEHGILLIRIPFYDNVIDELNKTFNVT